jgi:hypothetical protein
MRRSLVGFGVLGLLSTTAACMPPPVKAVDSWLTAYEKGDVEAMLANTVAADRALVKKALEAGTSSKASDLELAMPTKPKEHEIKEIDSKDPDGQWQVVIAKVTMTNPLPAVSKKIGQNLEGIPEQRSQWRKFKAVKEGDTWGVRLDLAAVIARTEFVTKFQKLLERGKVDEAEKLLESVPPPPDDPNAQKTADRLKDALAADLKARREQLAAPPESPPPTNPTETQPTETAP